MNVKLLVSSVFCVGIVCAQQGVAPARSAQAAMPTKTAWVDMNKIFSDDAQAPEEAREGIARVKADLQEREAKMKTSFEKYQKEATEFQKSKNPARLEEVRKMEANLKIEEQAAEAYGAQAQQDLQARIAPKVQKAVSTVAERQGWDMVDYLPKLYVKPEADITKEVIAEMNKDYKALKFAQKAPRKADAAKEVKA